MDAATNTSLNEKHLGTDISTLSEKAPAPTAPHGSDSVQTEKDLEFGLETCNIEAPADSSKRQTRRLVLVVVVLAIVAVAVAVAVAVGLKVAATQQNNTSSNHAESTPSTPEPPTGSDELASTIFPSVTPSSIVPTPYPTFDLNPTAAPTFPEFWHEVDIDTDFLTSEETTVASSAVSSVGNVLAIGSLDSTNLFRGAVNVYRLTNDTSGSQEFSPIGQQLVGANTNDYFGYSVALSSDGTVLAIGATQSGDDYDIATTGVGT